MNSKKERNVLRVTQLDAGRIDNEIFRMLQSELKSSLLNDSLSTLLYLEPEFNVILRFVLWKLSIKKLGVLIGQKMFNTEYKCLEEKLTENQKSLFAFTIVLIPWLKERYPSVVKGVKYLLDADDDSQYWRHFEKLFDHIDILVKLLSLINFLLFLKYGKCATILERVLKLDHVFSGNPKPRYIDYEYMRKEMIWDGVTQALLCVLPLINLKKVANTLGNIFKGSKETESDSRYLCKICSETATNPYNGECDHTFCYFCIKSNIMADKDYTCPACGVLISDIAPCSQTV